MCTGLYCRRSAGPAGATGPDSDSVFRLVSDLDSAACAKQFLCQLHSRPAGRRSPQEEMLVAATDSRQQHRAGAAQLEYDAAASLGRQFQSDEVCWQTYRACPYSSSQLATAFNEL